jgi:hypothetical protein
MPNVFALNGRASLQRYDRAEPLISVTPDGENSTKETLAHLSVTEARLSSELLIIKALDLRIQSRPPVPAPVTLQELVRSARRRLAHERQKDSRHWLELRTGVLTQLKRVLER